MTRWPDRVGVDGACLLGQCRPRPLHRLAAAHGAKLALKTTVEAVAHLGSAVTELAVALVRQERAVEHGAVKAHLQCATHIGQVLAVIEVHADRSSGALGKSNQHRAHDVERG